MAEQRLHSAMAPIDVLTRVELEEVMTKGFDGLLRARYRGIDYMEVNGNGDGAATVTLPGPESGFAWALRLVAVALSAAGSASVYLGENTNSAPVGNAAAVASATGYAVIVTFSANQAVIRDGRAVTLATSGPGIFAWKILSKQVPDEMVGKL